MEPRAASPAARLAAIGEAGGGGHPDRRDVRAGHSGHQRSRARGGAGGFAPRPARKQQVMSCCGCRARSGISSMSGSNVHYPDRAQKVARPHPRAARRPRQRLALRPSHARPGPLGRPAARRFEASCRQQRPRERPCGAAHDGAISPAKSLARSDGTVVTAAYTRSMRGAQARRRRMMRQSFRSLRHAGSGRRDARPALRLHDGAPRGETARRRLRSPRMRRSCCSRSRTSRASPPKTISWTASATRWRSDRHPGAAQRRLRGFDVSLARAVHRAAAAGGRDQAALAKDVVARARRRERRALHHLDRRRDASRPTAAAASPARSARRAAAASASAGGKRNPTTRRSSGTSTTARTAGSVSTNVTGTSALVGVLVPLPFIARVQGTACDRLAGQLGAFLKGDDIPAAPVRGA